MNLKGNVVAVDDDQLVLEGLRAVFRTLGFIENAYFFSDPFEALECIKTKSIEAVISDEVMPKMSGVEFLAEVKLLIPETSLILLTGQASIASVNRALHEIGVYMFLEKPAMPERMRDVMRLAIQRTHKNRAVLL